MFKDPSGLKITLTGTKNTKDERFTAIQALTNDELSLDTKSGEITIKEKKEGDFITGTELIRKIMDKEIYCTIDWTEDDNGYALTEYNNKTGEILSVTIQYNPDYLTSHVVRNDNGEVYDETNGANYIVMGHELIHIYHYLYGTYYSIAGKKDANYYYAITIPTEFVYVNNESREEVETVGIDYSYDIINQDGSVWTRNVQASQNSYTENKLRKEHDMPIRVEY